MSIYGILPELGLTDEHPFYRAWTSLRQRCNNPNCTQYKWYGGRGISYDTSWNEFINFYNDMFPSWKENLTLDRKDNNKGYCKDNCRWATIQEQAQNKRDYAIDKRNRSGRKGVSWNSTKGKWQAQGFEAGKRVHLYIGPSFEEACQSRNTWEALHGQKL